MNIKLNRLEFEHSQMKGLGDRVRFAEDVQMRINGWPLNWRLRKLEHEHLMARTLHAANLETLCADCGAVMDTAVHHIDCILCGSVNTCSPYYC